jgi:predicted DNA-binding transcriptional regulator AlpA
MSGFTEYFNGIKDTRNLTVAQISELCGIHKTVIYRWMNGTDLPKNWGRLKPVLRTLGMTQSEITRLWVLYQKEVLGEENSRCIRKVMDIIELLEGKMAIYNSQNPGLYFEQPKIKEKFP